ncbi:MAG: hypothetical protein FWE74_03235 [Oscillospiraceae bacterium]|nr:hypothetical protein [Oscillospiraceae bacterium]
MKTREIPENVKIILPVTAMYNVIKSNHTEREADKANYISESDKAKKAIAQIALAVYGFKNHSESLPENARNSFIAIEQALKNNNIEILDYVGQKLTDELSERVKVEGWVDGSTPEETIHEAFSPEIRFSGELLHTAQVFCTRPPASKEITEEIPNVIEEEATKTDIEESTELDTGEVIQEHMENAAENKIGFFVRIKNIFTKK